MQELILGDVLASEEPTKVEIKAIGKFAYFKDLLASDIDKKEGETNQDLVTKMLFKGWVHKDGTPVFSSLEQAKKCKLKMVTHISTAMNDFNGLGKLEDVQEKIEEIEKN